MPIIFPFNQTGTLIATILFFASLIFCGFMALYLEGHKGERKRGCRISLIVAAFLCLYCEWCAVDIAFTLNPPKNATMKCVEK